MINGSGPKYRHLLPGEKIEIAFLFQAGTAWASWESVYKHCMCDAHYDVRLILITSTTIETSHNQGAEYFLCERNIPFTKEEDIDFNDFKPHIVMHKNK